MLTNVSSSIFSNSNSVFLKPMVFAEWNQNIYNPPYTVLAGTGTKQTNVTTSTTLSDATGSDVKSNFTTKKFEMTDDDQTITYTITPTATSPAYKIVTFIKTNKSYPIMANFSASGSFSQYGSSNAEINSYSWQKVETYIGGASSADNITSITYKIALNRFTTEDDLPIDILFTVPEVYPVSFFDYKFNSIYPPESVFTNFRPGESYVNTGSSLFSFPSSFREVVSVAHDIPPVTSISRLPNFIPSYDPTGFYKHALVNDMSPYKYFISDTSNKSITAVYESTGITTNKLVLKFNTLVATPTINIYINGSLITVDGSTSISLAANIAKESGGIREDAGVLVLYWNGSAWTRSRWSTMPSISQDGSISISTTVNKITVTQTASTLRDAFSDFKDRLTSSTYFDSDSSRMQVIEISPRIEINLSDYVLDLSVNKSMDSKSTPLPISSINSNDATINLSSIPLGNSSQPIPIFSNQSNYSGTALKNLLGKNVKFYLNYYLEDYHNSSNNSVVESNTLIPAGVFYSDAWSENDANQVAVQCFDITRYLQSAQVADYVSNKESVFTLITNMLDLSGFTDYDSYELTLACLNTNAPMDLAYFYVNSKDTTVIDALNQIFLPYQIVAYIDEYNVMRFSSLSQMLDAGSSDIVIDNSDVLEGGYSVVNKAKPGKISLRYQTPKIKQSPALQNLKLDEDSPSFIYTTSNEIVWSQQNADSVGMNYLANSMNESQNYFITDQNDLLDIFHTYNRDFQGYAAIENEIVSFAYKEYELSSDLIREDLEPTEPVKVSIKSTVELESEINKFNKQYQVGLRTSDGQTRPDSSTLVEPTGKITQVRRGLFGSKPSAHTVLDSGNAASKNITAKILYNDYETAVEDATYTTAYNNEFVPEVPSLSKVIFYPTTERSTVVTDSGTDYYHTYSAKIRLHETSDVSSGGVFFNFAVSPNVTPNTFFLELVKYNTYKLDGTTVNYPPVFNYALVLYRIAVNTTIGNDGPITTYDPEIIGYSNVTGVVKNIINNTEKVLEDDVVNNKVVYTVKSDPRYEYFNLRTSIYKSTGEDGESASITNLFSVFLNNYEIKGWQQYTEDGWIPFYPNTNTGLPKKLQYDDEFSTGAIFGAFISNDPIGIPGIPYITGFVATDPGSVREIYATHKPLKERSVNYYFQDREFLNGMVQGQNLFSSSKSYMMQTKPEVIGINTYDVQYTTPAAVLVSVWPVEYLLNYYPGNGPVEKKFMQTKTVEEHSLAYSSVINTGFRAKFAIANNSSHMVYLMKDSDESKQTTVRLNLWTHEIIANSDPEIIEKIIDPGNITETVQIDSNWIQSKEAATSLISVITNGIDYFSKDITLDIFGNPLIQIGDRVELTYPLAGINQQKYIVTSVSTDFSNGLSTRLGMTMIGSGVSY